MSLTGNLDSGKTTLSKLLAAPAGVKDNGEGLLRNRVYHYQKQEIVGKSTQTEHEIIGFDKNLVQVTS